MWFEKEGVETGYKVLLVEFFLAVLTNCVLNFYWTYLIVRQVYRTITRQGDKHFSGEDEEQETDVPKDHNNGEKLKLDAFETGLLQDPPPDGKSYKLSSCIF